MKCTFILFLSIVLNSVIAQLTVDPNLLIQSDVVTDYIPINFQLELEGQDSVWVHWEIVKADDWPMEWNCYIIDSNFSHLLGVLNTINGSNRINRFYENESREWVFHLSPNGIEGNSSIKIILYYLDFTTANHTPLDFTDIEYDGDTLSTSSFNIGLNIGESVGVDDFTVNQIIIYPNPANNLIRFDNDEGISFISIYNTLGERLEDCRHAAGQSHNIEHLNQGMYLVRLMNDGGQVIKTIKFSKR